MVDDSDATHRHRLALTAQCPLRPRVPPEREDAFPIRVASWGDGGSNVLVVHGGLQAISAIGGGPYNFNGQKCLARQGWRIRVPARPGFGTSPSRGRDDQLADVRWIESMIETSGGTHLWGHSFGGAEALLAAARRPALIRSLVLIEPDLWPLAAALPEAEVPPGWRAELDRRRAALLDATSPATYASHFLGSFQPGTSGTKVWLTRRALALLPELSKTIGCGILQANEADGAEFLDAIRTVEAARVPVLVVTGGWSPPRDELGAVAARLLGGTHAVVASRDHIVMRSNARGFNERVTRFMREAEARAPSRS